MKDLGARPTVVVVDGLRHNEDVEHWITGLAVALRIGSSRVVVVVAGREQEVQGFVPLADAAVLVEPFTEADLREHLSALGALLDPPADHVEIDALTGEAVAAPQLIGPLVRALSYARRDG